MRNRISTLAFALLVFAPPVFADEDMQHDATKAITLDTKDLKWGDPPPEIPKGAKLAVLFGDPTKSGAFTIRIKAPGGYKIAPHWHTNDEQLTVLSGTMVIHMGDTMKADPHRLVAGSFHFLPGKMHHAAETKGATVLQISGEGPFDIHYLNESDNPNKSPETAKK